EGEPDILDNPFTHASPSSRRSLVLRRCRATPIAAPIEATTAAPPRTAPHLPDLLGPDPWLMPKGRPPCGGIGGGGGGPLGSSGCSWPVAASWNLTAPRCACVVGTPASLSATAYSRSTSRAVS